MAPMKPAGIWVAVFTFLMFIASSSANEDQLPSPAGSKADVDTDAALLGALQDQSVSLIVLTANVAVDPGFWSYVELPVNVNRSLTITGLPGSNPLLNLNRQTGVVRLCGTCTLRLANINIANSTKNGVGTLLFFRGQNGSRLVLENVCSLQLVCPFTAGELAVINQTQRSKLFADPNGTQRFGITNISYLGQNFQGAFHAIDVSHDVPLTLVTASTFAGGFAVHYINVARLCWSYVSEACLASGQGLEVCLTAQTTQMLAAMQKGASQASTARAAAIAVPVAVVGALVLAAGLLLHRRHKRKQAAHQHLPRYSSGSKNASADFEVVAHPSHGGALQLQMLLAAAAPRAGSTAGAAAFTHDDNMQQDRLLGLSTNSGGTCVTMGPVTTSPAGDGVGSNDLGKIFGPAAPQSSTSTAPSGDSFATPPHGGPISPLSPMAAATGGWQLTSSHITPGLQAAADAAGSTIEWGELLGAGSFGRVYKCRWAGMDVAVKVIQHDAAALQAVENEVQLQMYLQHPNIVRAFHCVTHTHKPNSTSRSSPINSARSGGGLAANIMTRLTVKTALNSSGKRPVATQDTPSMQDSNAGQSWLTQQQQQRLSVLTHLLQQERSEHGGSAGGQLQKQQQGWQPSCDRASYTQQSLTYPMTPAGHSTDLQRLVSPDSCTISGGINSAAAAAQTSSTLSSSLVPASPRWDAYEYNTSSSIQHNALVANTAAAATDALPTMEASMQQQQQQPPPLEFIPFVSSSAISSAAATEAASARAGLAAMGSRNTDAEAADGAAAAAAAAPVAVCSNDNTSNCSTTQLVTSGVGMSGDDEAPLSSAAPAGWPILQLGSSRETRETSLNATIRPSASFAAASSSLRMTGPGRSALAKPTFKASEISETWLVQELCDCGTLASIAANYWSRETEDDLQMLQRLLLLQDVARGLGFLHSKNIVHSDLNANNVLVTSSETSINGLVAKLADLGLSRVINHHRSHRTTHTFGTLSHMPPCLLREGRLSTRADVYAFGVMMWELFTGEPAWQGLHYGQLFQQVVLEHSRPEVPADMPTDYACLMIHCWAEDPNDRPPADAVLQCLDIMVQERLQHLGGGYSNDSEGPALQGQAPQQGPACAVPDV